jgi:hypothetical protein
LESHQIIEWHSDPLSADLGVVELDRVPFPVRRIYWISHFKVETIRGNHAHKNLTQLMVPLSGSLDVILFTGRHSAEFRLSAGDEPILIKPGMWRVMRNATEDAVVMVLASEKYDESDYIRDWQQYLSWHEARE